MKPRILKHAGLWWCGVPGGFVGFGYSPEMAYDEWVGLSRLARRRA